jgi:serine/threonine protein kinase
MFTLHYLSPEIVFNLNQDYRMDIWAFGVMCYELVIGKTPFEFDDHNQLDLH